MPPSPPAILCQLRHATGAVEYRLHRTTRRRLVLQVTREGTVEVRVPPRLPRGTVEAFVLRNWAWLQQRIDAARAALAARPPLGDGSPLPLLDGELVLRLRGPEGGPSRQVGGELWLPLSPATPREGIAGALEGWYRHHARAHFTQRLHHWAGQMGTTWSGLTIRGQRTRWGSCSTAGRISLNWKLLLLPAAVADYVVIHELAHRVRPDHSPAFWDLVARHDPWFRHHRARLRAFTPPW